MLKRLTQALNSREREMLSGFKAMLVEERTGHLMVLNL